MKLAILITNPNHHLELTLEVAKLAKQAGNQVRYISLCELRRMPSPTDVFKKEELDFVKFSELPKQLKPSSGKQSLGKSDSSIRALVRNLFWFLKIKPFIKTAIKGVDKVILMNDAAFPGDKISNFLKRKGISFYLIQEGIRFPLPNETEVKYGGNGASKVFAWGKRSATHFKEVAGKDTKVVVSGSPRFDMFLNSFERMGKERVSGKRLGIFTNPIDDQGFCTKAEKLNLFESFVKRGASYLNNNKVAVSIKSHPREDVHEYLSIAEKYLDSFEQAPDSIMEAISDVSAGVVMASTVGLELLGAKRRFGQMEIPEYGYVFDYTDDPDVIKIPLTGTFELDTLFEDSIDLTYFHEHIDVGESSERIYQQIQD